MATQHARRTKRKNLKKTKNNPLLMNTKEKLFQKLETQVKDSSNTLKDADMVAMLAGPSLVIETIVREASRRSGIEMDWGYCAGRAIVRSKGDIKKCRGALLSSIPQSDLTENDRFP